MEDDVQWLASLKASATARRDELSAQLSRCALQRAEARADDELATREEHLSTELKGLDLYLGELTCRLGPPAVLPEPLVRSGVLQVSEILPSLVVKEKQLRLLASEPVQLEVFGLQYLSAGGGPADSEYYMTLEQTCKQEDGLSGALSGAVKKVARSTMLTAALLTTSTSKRATWQFNVPHCLPVEFGNLIVASVFSRVRLGKDNFLGRCGFCASSVFLLQSVFLQSAMDIKFDLRAVFSTRDSEGNNGAGVGTLVLRVGVNQLPWQGLKLLGEEFLSPAMLRRYATGERSWQDSARQAELSLFRQLSKVAPLEEKEAETRGQLAVRHATQAIHTLKSLQRTKEAAANASETVQRLIQAGGSQAHHAKEAAREAVMEKLEPFLNVVGKVREYLPQELSGAQSRFLHAVGFSLLSGALWVLAHAVASFHGDLDQTQSIQAWINAITGAFSGDTDALMEQIASNEGAWKAAMQDTLAALDQPLANATSSVPPPPPALTLALAYLSAIGGSALLGYLTVIFPLHMVTASVLFVGYTSFSSQLTAISGPLSMSAIVLLGSLLFSPYVLFLEVALGDRTNASFVSGQFTPRLMLLASFAVALALATANPEVLVPALVAYVPLAKSSLPLTSRKHPKTWLQMSVLPAILVAVIWPLSSDPFAWSCGILCVGLFVVCLGIDCYECHVAHQHSAHSLTFFASVFAGGTCFVVVLFIEMYHIWIWRLLATLIVFALNSIIKLGPVLDSGQKPSKGTPFRLLAVLFVLRALPAAWLPPPLSEKFWHCVLGPCLVVSSVARAKKLGHENGCSRENCACVLSYSGLCYWELAALIPCALPALHGSERAVGLCVGLTLLVVVHTLQAGNGTKYVATVHASTVVILALLLLCVCGLLPVPLSPEAVEVVVFTQTCLLLLGASYLALGPLESADSSVFSLSRLHHAILMSVLLLTTILKGLYFQFKLSLVVMLCATAAGLVLVPATRCAPYVNLLCQGTLCFLVRFGVLFIQETFEHSFLAQFPDTLHRWGLLCLWVGFTWWAIPKFRARTSTDLSPPAESPAPALVALPENPPVPDLPAIVPPPPISNSVSNEALALHSETPLPLSENPSSDTPTTPPAPLSKPFFSIVKAKYLLLISSLPKPSFSAVVESIRMPEGQALLYAMAMFGLSVPAYSFSSETGLLLCAGLGPAIACFALCKSAGGVRMLAYAIPLTQIFIASAVGSVVSQSCVYVVALRFLMEQLVNSFELAGTLLSYLPLGPGIVMYVLCLLFSSLQPDSPGGILGFEPNALRSSALLEVSGLLGVLQLTYRRGKGREGSWTTALLGGCLLGLSTQPSDALQLQNCYLGASGIYLFLAYFSESENRLVLQLRRYAIAVFVLLVNQLLVHSDYLFWTGAVMCGFAFGRQAEHARGAALIVPALIGPITFAVAFACESTVLFALASVQMLLGLPLLLGHMGPALIYLGWLVGPVSLYVMFHLQSMAQPEISSTS